MKLFAIWMKTLRKLWQTEFALAETQIECQKLAAENARLKAKEVFRESDRIKASVSA